MAAIQWKPLWKYIEERERIRLRKGEMVPPYTTDAILAKFKFTNVKRENDRTTQAFLKTYAAHADAPPDIALYNCALRRFTGTIDADAALGWVMKPPLKVLERACLACEGTGGQFWTGAYMIRGGAAGVPKWRAVADYLGDLWEKRKEITGNMERERSWRVGFGFMQTCYGFGGAGFMAKEVLQDYLLWRKLAKMKPLLDEVTWTPFGPGGRRGLNRLKGQKLSTPVDKDTALEDIATLLGHIQPLWLKTFRKEEPLTAHDIQFCLCELDKYERVRLNQGRPRSTYKPTKETT